MPGKFSFFDGVREAQKGYLHDGNLPEFHRGLARWADEPTIGSLRPAEEMLRDFGLRTERVILGPDGPMPSVSRRFVCAIIIGSPDAALPGMLAARTALPVIRVPLAGNGRSGMALLTDGGKNLPAGPTDGAFATMAIGEPGAKNAALFVVASLAATDVGIRTAWNQFRTRQTEAVLQHPPLEQKD